MCHNESTAPELSDIAQQQQVELADERIPTTIFEPNADPDTRAELPLIVIATDIYGVNSFYRYLATRLAATGYRVAIPDLFHRLGPATNDSRDAALARRRLLDDVQAIADVEMTIRQLAKNVASSQSGTPARYVLIGFCLGGSLALLTAAKHPEQGTITYYAFPRGAPGARVPAPEPVAVADTIAGPVLAFWGRQDYIDAGEVDELTAALERAPGECEVVWYERAGHSFLSGLTTPGEESEAATDSWERSMAFLARHLPSPRRPA